MGRASIAPCVVFVGLSASLSGCFVSHEAAGARDAGPGPRDAGILDAAPDEFDAGGRRDAAVLRDAGASIRDGAVPRDPAATIPCVPGTTGYIVDRCAGGALIWRSDPSGVPTCASSCCFSDVAMLRASEPLLTDATGLGCFTEGELAQFGCVLDGSVRRVSDACGGLPDTPPAP